MAIYNIVIYFTQNLTMALPDYNSIAWQVLRYTYSANIDKDVSCVELSSL